MIIQKPSGMDGVWLECRTRKVLIYLFFFYIYSSCSSISSVILDRISSAREREVLPAKMMDISRGPQGTYPLCVATPP